MASSGSFLNSRGAPVTLFVVSLVALILFLTIYSNVRETETQLSNELKPSNSKDYLESLVASLNPNDRCNDPDDPPSWHQDTCECGDPIEPVRRKKEERDAWMDHHDRLRSLASAVSSEKWDVLILGDSVVELWMGTKNMGKVEVPEFSDVFGQSFSKKTYKEAHLNGVPMGSAGDSSPELLWHLKHGMFPPTLQPRAILIVIGEHDLSGSNCSKRNALAGILNVADWLHKQRPNAAIILHGILPRGDNKELELGVKWKQIEWVNRNMEQYTTAHDGWYYLDNSELFLRNDDPDVIDSSLLEGGVHPTLEGYKRWTPLVAKQIMAILVEKEQARRLR